MISVRKCVYTIGGGYWGLGTIQGGPFKSEATFAVSSPYGPRPSLDTPQGPTGDFHNGLDIAAPTYTPLVALFAGVVTVAESGDPNVGNWVSYQVGDPAGEYAAVEYYHMVDPPLVHAGDTVRQGDLLGYVGTTGKSNGPHLHIGVKNGAGYIDPFNFLMLGAAPEPVVEEQRSLSVEALVAYLRSGGAFVDLGKSSVIEGAREIRILLPDS